MMWAGLACGFGAGILVGIFAYVATEMQELRALKLNAENRQLELDEFVREVAEKIEAIRSDGR